MAVIFLNLRGSPSSGGPTVASFRLAQGFSKRGHKVIFDAPNKADVCLCIIESGKVLRQVDRKRTKIAVRLDGIYAKEYWHGGKGREWRPDMTQLHVAVKRDAEQVDHMVYQSSFSKSLIDAEIAERKDNFSIINNGVDTNLFIPRQRKPDGFINLFSHAVMRNNYIMESLIGVYREIQLRHKVRLVLVGSMDAECSSIYAKYKSDPNIIYFGSIPNSKLPQIFENADIGLYPRSGSSSDNVIPEALSCGVPVVIPAWSGNTEMLFNEQQGIIVSSGGHWNYGPDYIKKLAAGVEKIIPDLAGFKLRARTHAVKNLTIDIMVDKYLKSMGI